MLVAFLAAALTGTVRLAAQDSDPALTLEPPCSDADLQCRLDRSRPGETITLEAGTYSGAFFITTSGLPNEPITLVADGHAIVRGSIRIDGSHWRIIGLDITDPGNIAWGAGVEVRGADIQLINNVIHDHCDANGLGAWNLGADQVFYGNILYGNGCDPTFVEDGSRLRHPHNVYTQNSVEEFDYKTFENNVILEPACGAGCFAFHAFGSSRASLSGYRIMNNIFGPANVLMGGSSPVYAQAWTGNIFLNSNIAFGYWDVATVEFTENTLFVGRLQFPYLWSDDPQRPHPNNITGNEFLATKIEVKTAMLAEEGELIERVPISTADTWDYNRYFLSDESSGTVKTAAGDSWFSSLEEWQHLTSFDQHSSVVALPAEPQIALMPENRYEPGLRYVAIAGYGASEAVLEIPGMLRVFRFDGMWETPIAAGIDAVTVPLDGDYAVFAVRVTESASDRASYIVIGSQAINVRFCASTACLVVATLVPGDQMHVVGAQNGQFVLGSEVWYEVLLDDKPVYIHSALLAPSDEQ